MSQHGIAQSQAAQLQVIVAQVAGHISQAKAAEMIGVPQERYQQLRHEAVVAAIAMTGPTCEWRRMLDGDRWSIWRRECGAVDVLRKATNSNDKVCDFCGRLVVMRETK